MCQGGQGERQRVPRVSHPSQHWDFFLLFPCSALWRLWSGREGDGRSPQGPCNHSDLEEVPQEFVPLAAPCKSSWSCSVRGIQLGKDLEGDGARWQLCHDPVLLELTPASNSCSSPAVFEFRLPGWQLFGVFTELHPAGIAKQSRSCWPGTSIPVGFLFLHEPFLQLGGKPALQKPGGFMSSWWIFNDLFFFNFLQNLQCFPSQTPCSGKQAFVWNGPLGGHGVQRDSGTVEQTLKALQLD